MRTIKGEFKYFGSAETYVDFCDGSGRATLGEAMLASDHLVFDGVLIGAGFILGTASAVVGQVARVTEHAGATMLHAGMKDAMLNITRIDSFMNNVLN